MEQVPDVAAMHQHRVWSQRVRTLGALPTKCKENAALTIE